MRMSSRFWRTFAASGSLWRQVCVLLEPRWEEGSALRNMFAVSARREVRVSDRCRSAPWMRVHARANHVVQLCAVASATARCCIDEVLVRFKGKVARCLKQATHLPNIRWRAVSALEVGFLEREYAVRCKPD